MALIKSVRGFNPEVGENCYLAENATIVGDVKIGKDCSIWFNEYHQMVYNRLKPFLNEQEQAWLEEATSPLKR